MLNVSNNAAVAQDAQAGRTNREYHPLANIQYNQIIRRAFQTRKQLEGLWGVTWSLQGRTWTKLGQASMMVVSYHPGVDTDRGTVELRCISAYYDREANAIVYGKVRMSHDLSRVMFAGARERTLDPRDPSDNQFNAGNASWARLALQLDKEVVRSANNSSHLPVLPMLPEFYAAFSSMDAIDMDITPDLLQLIAERKQISVEAVQQLDAGDINLAAAEVWPDLWIEPNGEGNVTNKWLINSRYTMQLAKAEQIYEDFSQIVGYQVWNPVKEIREFVVQNPAAELAKTNEVDLALLFGTLDGKIAPTDPAVAGTELAHGTEYVKEMLQNLVTAMRQSIPDVYASQLTDEHIVALLRNTKAKATLPISDPAKQMLPEDVLKAARLILQTDRPTVSECTTDDDIMAVYDTPKQPLFVSRMPRLQVLARDPRMDVEAAFSFSLGMCAPNVAANLWAGPDWIPESPKGARYDRSARSTPAVRSVVIAAD